MISTQLRNIDLDDVKVPRLPQSKLYLKILGIPYLIENMNVSISANVIEIVLKTTHFFNNIILVLKPYVIKAKSDMVVI